jgi:hypothetical protein
MKFQKLSRGPLAHTVICGSFQRYLFQIDAYMSLLTTNISPHLLNQHSTVDVKHADAIRAPRSPHQVVARTVSDAPGEGDMP